MSCSLVCQVDTLNGYLYSTNYFDCQSNNKTAAGYATLGYAFTMHIPGLTDAIYQMISNTNNNTLMVYGLSQMTTKMNQNYRVGNIFFVPLTAIISGMSQYSILLNSASVSTATNSLIIKYSDPLYTNLTQNNWYDNGLFYLYQSQINGTCKFYDNTTTS